MSTFDRGRDDTSRWQSLNVASANATRGVFNINELTFWSTQNYAVPLRLQIIKIMVKHIILWTLNPELSEEEKAQVKVGIKEGLEGLKGKVPGLLDVVVNISGRLASSNCDVMLDSTLESAEALKAYATHPAHVAVADTKVRPYTVQRTCLDFEV